MPSINNVGDFASKLGDLADEHIPDNIKNKIKDKIPKIPEF